MVPLPSKLCLTDAAFFQTSRLARQRTHVIQLGTAHFGVTLNLDLQQVGGAVLAVSQFTLGASIRRGRRPSFDRAMHAKAAEPLFDKFVDLIRERGIHVETGRFRAFMDVEMVNSGPVTLLWDDPPGA